MKNIFSINSAAQKLLLLAKRFPISVLFIVAFACLLFIKIKIPYQLSIFLSFGTVIGTVAVLWLEDFVNYIKQQIITFVAVFLWGVYCFFLPTSNKLDATEAKLVGIGVAVFLSLFFISFLKKNKDKAFWNFTIQTSFQLCIAILFGLVISTGLAAAVYAFDTLFDIYIFELFTKSKLLETCFVLFTPIYFLANVPDKIAKHNEEISLNKQLKILALYILIPIAAIYAVILYIYLFKIIITWELPNDGLVSYLVSALAFSGLFIISLLYPVRLEEKNKFIVFLSRYFGIVMLPLFTLMTIGIFRRISDYGITISRLYILLINIWFYGIYIYMFITKAKRIKFIFISFAAISLLVSVGFWSVPNITKSILISEINSYLGDQKISLSDKYSLDKIDKKDRKKDRKKVTDKIYYLYKKYEKQSIQPFFIDSVYKGGFDKDFSNFYDYLYMKEIFGDDYEGNKISFTVYDRLKNNVNYINMKNFNTFAPFHFLHDPDNKNIRFFFDNGDVTIRVISDNRNFHVPMRSLTKDLIVESIEKDKSPSREVSISNILEGNIFQGSDYSVLINRFSGDYYKTQDSIEVYYFSGYLFYNSDIVVSND